MGFLTEPGGWCSHRIDLTDHGRRETNYLELLQWSEWSYWLTQRFVLGALNRWRASNHVNKLESIGFKVLQQKGDMRQALPIPRRILAREFRALDELDLLTTGLDLVAVKVQ